jgi:hypothetical protein
MSKRGKALANSQAAFKQMEDSEKSVLAEYIQRARDNGAKSIAEAETIARGSKEFKEFIGEKAGLRKEYLLAQVNYETMKVHIEMLRSNQSFEKAQMGMI